MSTVIEALLNQESTFTILLVDPLGNPVSGVIDSLMDPYYVKANGVTGSLSSLGAEFTLTEPDPVNMTGVYRFTITAAGVLTGVLDTLGPLTMMLNPTGGASYLEYPAELRVVPSYYWESLRRLLGLSQENQKLTVIASNLAGFMTQGILEIFTDNTLVTPITSYQIDVIYDPSNVLVSYTAKEL